MDELKKKKEKLMNMRTNLQKELNEINEQILNVDFKIIQECGKTTGHEFVTERELGIYGERFTWCRNCNYGN